MSWWRILRRNKQDQPETQAEKQSPSQSALKRQARHEIDATDPTVRDRRRRRLERRIRDLQYDIALAESASSTENRWTNRIDELDQAVEQAREEMSRVETPPGGETPVTLPTWPVIIDEIRPDEPSEVRLQIGEVAFRYSEEIDWSERGHQRSELQLRRFAGDIEALIPEETPVDRRNDLKEHLAHSVGALAIRLRDDELAGNPRVEVTLFDLATPCPDCNGWRDLMDRCLDCQRRVWQAEEIHAEIERLLDERNHQLDEARRWQESLPILRRQLASAEAELEKYR